MMKMQIALDEEKVISDGVYDLDDMWRIIDEKFSKACTKERLADGSVMYTGDPRKDYYAEIGLAYLSLKKQKWFADYCIGWVLSSNDDDDELPLDNENLLEKERNRNPLFAI